MNLSWQYKLAQLFQSTSFTEAVTVLDCQSIPSMEVGLVDWLWLVVRSMTSRPLFASSALSRILNIQGGGIIGNSVASKQAVWRVSPKSFLTEEGEQRGSFVAVSGRQWRQTAATRARRTWSRPGCCLAGCRLNPRRRSSQGLGTQSTRYSVWTAGPQSREEPSPAVSSADVSVRRY